MSDLSAFQRSRIYAKGWNAAREPTADGALRRDVINPYPLEPEKSRWDEGFANARRSNRQQLRFTPARPEADPAADRA